MNCWPSFRFHFCAFYVSFYCGSVGPSWGRFKKLMIAAVAWVLDALRCD